MEIVIVLIVALLIAIWVYNDAIIRGKSSGDALIWFIGVFGLMIIFLPLWLILRPKLPQEVQKVEVLEKPSLCPYCGKYYRGTISFCPLCGAKVME
jgi:hypothetical protein